MDEVRQIIEALKEYRAELVHKNYPMGKINELIIKWEDWLNTPQEERFKQRMLDEEQALKEKYGEDMSSDNNGLQVKRHRIKDVMSNEDKPAEGISWDEVAKKD